MKSCSALIFCTLVNGRLYYLWNAGMVHSDLQASRQKYSSVCSWKLIVKLSTKEIQAPKGVKNKVILLPLKS